MYYEYRQLLRLEQYTLLGTTLSTAPLDAL